MDIPRKLSRSATIALVLSPVGVLLVSTTRLLIISDYNTSTASAVVSSGGYVNTLLGTIIPLVPIFMPYLGITLLFFRRVIPGVLCLIASVFISPINSSGGKVLKLATKIWGPLLGESWIHLSAYGLLLIAVGVICTFALAGGFNTFAKAVGTVLCLFLIPYVIQLYPLPHNNNFYADQLRAPWLPAEEITLESHQQVTGYVLSGDGEWLVVLVADGRKLVYYPTGEVENRQVCQIGGYAPQRPLFPLVPKAATVPQCPQSAIGSHGTRQGHAHRPVHALPTGCVPLLRPDMIPIGSLECE
jgi:hypothetical protein